MKEYKDKVPRKQGAPECGIRLKTVTSKKQKAIDKLNKLLGGVLE